MINVCVKSKNILVLGVKTVEISTNIEAGIDAHGSGPCEGSFMKVRILLSAPERRASPVKETLFFFVDIQEDSNLRP